MRQILLWLLPLPALACAFHLEPPRYTEIRLDRDEKILVFKDRSIDPDLERWLEDTIVDEPLSTLELAKFLTKEISQEFDSPGKFSGSPFNLIGMAIHNIRNRAYENTFDSSIRSYFAGDIIRARMASNRQRAALLLAVLESQGLEPKIKYGLANSHSHTWLTLMIRGQNYILDPTLRLVAPIDEVNVYRAQTRYKGKSIEVRYEEMGDYELRRLSEAQIKGHSP